ncbi:MAG: T9SS type A sorting domain-containing protein [Saprospiraceae bacterium]|nr:T9SS type A sorting domain-containing protein [Saprospiraceae bacterium]
MKCNLKCWFVFAIILSVVTLGIGQQHYGNEWIRASKTYLKLKVAENGMYRVTYDQMVAAGLISSQVDGFSFQLFNYGKEQPIYVSNNNFGKGEYIEFYGVKNTIGLDSLLYQNWRKDLFNPEYSLVNDTNAYFLTLSPESNNKRFTLITPNYNNINLTPAPYYIHKEKLVFSDTYFKNIESSEIRNSYFEPSEGFGTSITLNNSNTVFNVSKIYDDGPAPTLSCRLGNNNQTSRLELSFNGNLLETVMNPPKGTLQWDYTMSKSLLKNGNNTLNIRNTFSNNDRHRIAVATLTYARTFDFQGKNEFSFTMPASTDPVFIKADAFNYTNRNVRVVDPESGLIYTTAVSGNQLLIRLNPASRPSEYITLDESAVKAITDMRLFTPKSFADVGTEYLIITSPDLKNTTTDFVAEYAEYRRSDQGGAYKTDVLYVQDIYDNFGYGIDRHFYGFKNLAKYLHDNWKQLNYVFIIGRGIEYPYIRKAEDVYAKNGKTFFIPTYGFIGSDNMLFSEGNYPDPYFSVGRLAARTGTQVKDYLDKIKQYEAVPFLNQTIDNKLWTKNVLHLGGGKSQSEQAAIQSGLENIGSVLADTIFGANILAYYKKTGDPVQFGVNEEINNLFNQGVGIINFFGHSSAGTWDFPIENPRNYENYGRYPIINSLGCYSGNLHSDTKGISESFVLEKDRGSILFIASTGTAFIRDLSKYAYTFYDYIFNKDRTKSLGDALKYAANANRTATGGALALYAQLTYHGDPALKLHLYDAPDYLFDVTSVKTLPGTVQAGLEHYEVQLDAVNLGASVEDSVHVVFYHQVADGTIVDTIYLNLGPIANRKSMKITLHNYGQASVGKNILLAEINPGGIIKETPQPVAAQNNKLFDGRGFEFYVSDNYATTVYPPNFAMINTAEHFVLKASTSSAPLKQSTYVFQIDTTAYFNSPLLEVGKEQSEGGLIEYKPKTGLVADRVYYWRVSPDSTATEGFKWSNASFAYLPDEEEGWNQSHFFQFTQNDLSDMTISEKTNRKLQYGLNYLSVKVKNSIWNPDDRPGYIVNNVNYGSTRAWDFMDAGIAFVINNDLDFWEPVVPPGGLYGSYNPTSKNLTVFAYKTDTPENRQKAVEFLENQVKEGKFLTVYTIQKNAKSNYRPEEWAADSLIYGRNLFSALEKLGAKRVRELEQLGSVPYIMQMNYNDGLIAEEVATTINDVVENTATMYHRTQGGEFHSFPFGPVQQVKQLKYRFDGLVGQKDAYINFYVGDNNGNSILVDSLIRTNKEVSLDGHNYFYLGTHTTDSLTRVSPDLKFWRISYDALPDAAISFVKNEPDITQQTIYQGDKFQTHYQVKNVNFIDMDSILVKYSFSTNDNDVISGFKRLAPLKAGATIDDVITFDVGIGTINVGKVVIEINPDLDQPELHTFNNILTFQFGVAKDNDNPILNVTFDGIQIMDGDIVSPTPEICVRLYDDNNLLPITNPSAFEVKIDTGRNNFLVIDVNDPDVRFVPASSTEKEAKLYFKPNLKDGLYRLVVQGVDASGNKSGDNPKSVGFRVITAQSVSNVLNYPNPFSSSTQFIFTLTGSEVPENVSISIFTLSGRVVREITQEELGPIHAGLNRTTFKWNGTDEFGSKLANGVYLYKVNFRKKDGSQYDSFSNKKIDGFFKDGFGKLVIMR